jgi:hypothetical protein
MYRGVRSVHLCAGVFALVFLVVYGVSALQMTHGKWVHMEARTVTREVALPAGLTDARAASRELAVREGIAGELQGIRVTASGVAFRVLRPGMVWAADYVSATGVTRLRITDTGTLGALNRIHQMRGLWHTWVAYNIWVGLLLLVSVGVLVLGATGLYLWWVSHKDKRWTGALLGVSVAVIGGLAAWMRMGA